MAPGRPKVWGEFGHGLARSARDVWETRLHQGRASQKGEKRMCKPEMFCEKLHVSTRSLVVYSASRQRLLSGLPL